MFYFDMVVFLGGSLHLPTRRHTADIPCQARGQEINLVKVLETFQLTMLHN